MFVPNLYTLREQGQQYGLHKFQDGVVMLAVKHDCGDWITICRPTYAQVSHFERYGKVAEKPETKR